MKIAGIVKSSFIDYPGRASAVIFFGGCNFACGYCHNGDIVRDQAGSMSPEELLDFLDKRKRFLDAVCISGGEPTLQRELVPFVRRIRERGYRVKLDTNGTNPRVLSELMEEGLLSYVAMDVKGPLSRYGEICGASPAQVEAVRESRAILIEAGKRGLACGVREMAGGVRGLAGEKEPAAPAFSCEFRTTVCKNQLSQEDLLAMAEEIRGARLLYLQRFREGVKLLIPDGGWLAYSQEEMEALAVRLRETGAVETVRVR